MKPNLKTVNLILLLFIALISPAIAKPASKIQGDAGKISTIVNGTPVYEGNINNQIAILETDFPKVAAAFSKMYCSAQSQVWFKSDKALHVSFKIGGNKIRAVLTLKGNLIYAIADLNTQAMPELISKAIQHKYPFFFVADVKQIAMADMIVYRVILESNNAFITVQADEEGVLEIKKMRKQLPLGKKDKPTVSTKQI